MVPDVVLVLVVVTTVAVLLVAVAVVFVPVLVVNVEMVVVLHWLKSWGHKSNKYPVQNTTNIHITCINILFTSCTGRIIVPTSKQAPIGDG